MTDQVFSGSCLCGAVAYTIEPPFRTFQYCHCSRCRKFTGSAHASNLFCPSSQFRWTRGEDQVGRYEVPGTKYHATCFCKTCGSSLPWENQGGGMVMVPAGTLDDDPGQRPVRCIYWQSRAPWHVETHELEKFDELPPRK